jgi:NarL family two-component system response regulator LiaR
VTTETTSSDPDHRVRVVLAAADDGARQTLAQQVAGLHGVDLVATEASAGDAIIATYRLHPDVVLLDLASPDRPAPDTIRHLLRVCPGVSVAMLVDQEEDARLTPALDAGARESLPKSAPPEHLASILRRLGPNASPRPGQ